MSAKSLDHASKAKIADDVRDVILTALSVLDRVDFINGIPTDVDACLYKSRMNLENAMIRVDRWSKQVAEESS